MHLHVMQIPAKGKHAAPDICIRLFRSFAGRLLRAHGAGAEVGPGGAIAALVLDGAAGFGAAGHVATSFVHAGSRPMVSMSNSD